MPDLFVASGCRCWNQPDKYPHTFGFQTDYMVEGKILGQYVKQNFAGKKVVLLRPGRRLRPGQRRPASTSTSGRRRQRQTLPPGNTNIGPQIAALKRGRQVVVSFTIPAYTALAHLAAQARLQAAAGRHNVGSDPMTVGGLLKAFAKGKAGAR